VGTSAASEQVSRPDGLMHKPEGGRQRRRCGRSKPRSGRTTQPAGEPRATGPVVQVRSLRCRLVARPITDPTSRTEIRTVTAYKPAWQSWRRKDLKGIRGRFSGNPTLLCQMLTSHRLFVIFASFCADPLRAIVAPPRRPARECAVCRLPVRSEIGPY